MHERRSERERVLYQTALTRGGLFRLDEAEALGFSRRVAAYRVERGEWERVGRGIYRLVFAPRSPDEDLVRIALWAHNPWGPVAFSHETALLIHDLSDLVPDRHHLTVPRRFDRKPPTGVSLHRSDLAPDDLEERTGYLVTSPLRTLLDIARSPRIAPEHLEVALAQVLERGLVRMSRLEEAAKGLPAAARKRLAKALAAVDFQRTGV